MCYYIITFPIQTETCQECGLALCKTTIDQRIQANPTPGSRFHRNPKTPTPQTARKENNPSSDLEGKQKEE